MHMHAVRALKHLPASQRHVHTLPPSRLAPKTHHDPVLLTKRNTSPVTLHQTSTTDPPEQVEHYNRPLNLAMSPPTADSAHNSLLLNLSAEPRNRIYEYARRQAAHCTRKNARNERLGTHA